MSTPQFIFTMHRVDKFHGPEKHVLKDVTLSFLAGAKIGVLGPNETCITATTRNFKGRMGDPSAKIFMGSPATVAASAITGTITDPRDFLN